MTAGNDSTFGTFRFWRPDPADDVKDRAFFTQATATEVKEEKQPLYDFNEAADVVKGPAGLDVQGFTFVKHRSALSPDKWTEGRNIEDIYVPELLDLMLTVTGGSHAKILNVAFRQSEPGIPETADGLAQTARRGTGRDDIIAKMPLDGIQVTGRNIKATAVARVAHCDFAPQGLRNSLAYFREDVNELGKPVLAVDPKSLSSSPRCAAYSVWRPVRTVRRDPLAVLDWRTTDKSELDTYEMKAPGQLTENGWYSVLQYAAAPPKDPGSQRWYWMPEQTPEDVLIIKFVDTAAENEAIAGGCIHASPWIEGTEDAEQRWSIESRVYVFWD